MINFKVVTLIVEISLLNLDIRLIVEHAALLRQQFCKFYGKYFGDSFVTSNMGSPQLVV